MNLVREIGDYCRELSDFHKSAARHLPVLRLGPPFIDAARSHEAFLGWRPLVIVARGPKVDEQEMICVGRLNGVEIVASPTEYEWEIVKEV